MFVNAGRIHDELDSQTTPFTTPSSVWASSGLGASGAALVPGRIVLHAGGGPPTGIPEVGDVPPIWQVLASGAFGEGVVGIYEEEVGPITILADSSGSHLIHAIANMLNEEGEAVSVVVSDLGLSSSPVFERSLASMAATAWRPQTQTQHAISRSSRIKFLSPKLQMDSQLERLEYVNLERSDLLDVAVQPAPLFNDIISTVMSTAELNEEMSLSSGDAALLDGIGMWRPTTVSRFGRRGRVNYGRPFAHHPGAKALVVRVASAGLVSSRRANWKWRQRPSVCRNLDRPSIAVAGMERGIATARSRFPYAQQPFG